MVAGTCHPSLIPRTQGLEWLVPHATLAHFDPAEGLSGSWDIPPGSDSKNPGSRVAGATCHSGSI